MAGKKSKERNDYSGPIEDRVDYNQFSKEFLLKLMAIWQDYWELMVNTFVKIGSEMEEVGPEKAGELLARTQETVTPSIMARTAELAKVDVNTVEGRCKAGMLGIDNIWEKYPGHWEVKSDKEVILKYDYCNVLANKLVGTSLEVLHRVCTELEPRYAMAYQNYPGVLPKVKVTMLKVPDSLTPKAGEPVCVWRFAFEE
jgi:hypothetical protein